MRTRSWLPVLALVSTGVAAGPAAAQSTKGSLGIRPPIVDVVAAPPRGLPQATITNTTRDAMKVTVFPTLLGQSLDGTLQTQERPDQLGAATRLLSVAPRAFTLEPGHQRTVAVRWLGTLPAAKAAYLGVVFSGIPRRAASGGVTFNPRLVQVNRLRRPGPYVSRGRLVGLRGAQAGVRKLRFFVGVRNLGEVAEKPRRTSFVIHDASGVAVLRTRWKAAPLILPGATVEVPVDLAEVLPAGRYVAQALMRFGRNPKLEKIERPFALAGPNLLPTPALKLGDVRPSGTPGGPAHVKVTVRSTGTAPASGTLAVSLLRLGGTKPIARTSAAAQRLGPKRDVVRELDVGRVEVGLYRVQVVLRDGGRVLDTRTEGFRVTAGRSFLDRYKGAVAGVGAAVLLLLLLLALLRGWRRRAELERELAAARAAQGPPPGPPDQP